MLVPHSTAWLQQLPGTNKVWMAFCGMPLARRVCIANMVCAQHVRTSDTCRSNDSRLEIVTPNTLSHSTLVEQLVVVQRQSAEILFWCQAWLTWSGSNQIIVFRPFFDVINFKWTGLNVRRWHYQIHGIDWWEWMEVWGCHYKEAGLMDEPWTFVVSDNTREVCSIITSQKIIIWNRFVYTKSHLRSVIRR